MLEDIVKDLVKSHLLLVPYHTIIVKFTNFFERTFSEAIFLSITMPVYTWRLEKTRSKSRTYPY